MTINPLLKRTVPLAALVMLNGVAFAAGGGHSESLEDVGSKIIFHAINLAILVGGLYWVANGMIRDALANRAANIAKEIQEATALRDEAQAKYDELMQKIENLSTLIQDMETEAERAASAEAAAIDARAERDVEMLQNTIERTIRDETQRARHALRQEAVTLAVEMAQATLQSQVNTEDQTRLTGEFLQVVKQSHNDEVQHG